jgi:hypothetical protein
MSDLGPFGYEVKDFCKAAHISKSTFYALQRKGLGPRMFKVSERRALIPPDAAEKWLEDRGAKEPQAA